MIHARPDPGPLGRRRHVSLAARDPAADQAVLRETLAQLDGDGYDRLRVADIGDRAGVGLGSLYRRWPTKYVLVVDALRAAASAREAEPAEDLVAGLVGFAEELGRHSALLALLLTDPSSEVAAAVREATPRPAHEAARERLRRVLGPVPDLETRADAGPALVVQHLILHGAAPDEAWIRERIVPLMTRRT